MSAPDNPFVEMFREHPPGFDRVVLVELTRGFGGRDIGWLGRRR